MRCAVLVGVTALLALGCTDNPTYDVKVVLPASDGGQGVDAQLSSGTASLKMFPCDVSIRLGQCVDGAPIQMVLVPAGNNNSGSNTCTPRSARTILGDNVGSTVTLGRGDAGLLWIQAFHGDDDDDSGLVERAEMSAYAELRRGTLSVTSFNGSRLEAEVVATDDSGLFRIEGTVGSLDGDNSAAVGVGPRCTWPIGAKAN